MTTPPYTPRGGAAAMVASRDAALLIDGPVYTGKTMSVLYKGLFCAQKYPNSRVLLVRKTRKSLTESVLVTFEEKILPPGSPITMHGGTRGGRTFYELGNGSVIVCGGMDPGAGTNNRGSVMSTEWDLILCFESTEFTEDEIQKLRTRLRNGSMPYQQIIMDCNPGAPTHFLIQGANKGAWTRCPSRHTDNPRMWDGDKWTAEGERYMAVLNQMTGHRLARLRDGKWASAEGVVYPEFDAAVHLIDRFDIPADWRRIRSIDFGYTNPFVCQWWAVDGDGRMYLYREVYHSRRIVEDHARDIKALSSGERIEASVSDHDAEDRATLDRHGIATVAASKDVTVGIQAVASRLRPAGDGKPRLYVLRDSRVQADPALAEAKFPTCTAEEWDGYVWATAKDGKPIKEEPVKVGDHGLDACRYCAMYLDSGIKVGASLVAAIAPPEPVKVESPQAHFARMREDANWGFERV